MINFMTEKLKDTAKKNYSYSLQIISFLQQTSLKTLGMESHRMEVWAWCSLRPFWTHQTSVAGCVRWGWRLADRTLVEGGKFWYGPGRYFDALFSCISDTDTYYDSQKLFSNKTCIWSYSQSWCGLWIWYVARVPLVARMFDYNPYICRVSPWCESWCESRVLRERRILSDNVDRCRFESFSLPRQLLSP